MPGKKSLDEFESFVYDNLKDQYKQYGRYLYWEMKDGNTIKIKDMKHSHLKNTINMLRRKEQNGSRVAWIEILENESLYRRSKKIEKITENVHKKKGL